ncbi:MAG: hypothetical protein R2744_01150 [Bacteroidales bacterium]
MMKSKLSIFLAIIVSAGALAQEQKEISTKIERATLSPDRAQLSVWQRQPLLPDHHTRLRDYLRYHEGDKYRLKEPVIL